MGGGGDSRLEAKLVMYTTDGVLSLNSSTVLVSSAVKCVRASASGTGANARFAAMSAAPSNAPSCLRASCQGSSDRDSDRGSDRDSDSASDRASDRGCDWDSDRDSEVPLEAGCSAWHL